LLFEYTILALSSNKSKGDPTTQWYKGDIISGPKRCLLSEIKSLKNPLEIYAILKNIKEPCHFLLVDEKAIYSFQD